MSDDAQSDEVRMRPLHYWDDLRSTATEYVSEEGSAVFSVFTGENSETIRLVHVVGINPVSEMLADGTQLRVDQLAHIQAATFLALHHFNQRSAAVMPHLPLLLKDCNIYMTVDFLDTILSPIEGSKRALPYLLRTPGILDSPLPIALHGAGRSAVSQPLSVLTGIYNVPQINGMSTSSALDNKDSSPTFTRAIPTNLLDSRATVTYLQHLGVHHLGVLFIRDAYGSEFNRDLTSAATEFNMTVISAAYNDGDDDSVVGALAKLKETQFRYFFAILTPATEKHKIVIRNALDLGIMGNPNYVWFFAEASTLLLKDGFYTATLNSSLESDREIAAALDGSGLIVLETPSNKGLDTELKEIGTNTELFDYYVSRTELPALYANFTQAPVPDFFQYACYDAMIALGISLCDMEDEHIFPTGRQVLEAYKSTKFVGASGPVSFDNITGTRSAESVTFKVINFLVDTSTEGSIKWDSPLAARINISSQQVEVVTPFVYPGGMLEPPMTLPEFTIDLNLLETGVRVVGWILAGVVILTSIGLSCWTFKYRDKYIVRVAQPVFLGLLCLGTVLMAATIVPMSFQEPMSQETLDRGCMALPWLFVMGFSFAFSSLFCKLQRINKVFRQSAGMHRVEVKAKDVMLSFIILFVANFAVLLAWTLVAPLQWSRVEAAKYDRYERSLESYGTCFAPDEGWTRNAFLVAIGVFNFVAVIFADYQCYLSRYEPSDFHEPIGISMLFIIEGFLLGIPILVISIGSPTASYIIGSVLISFLCLAILLPIFGSKIAKRHARLRRSVWRKAWKNHGTTSRERQRASDEVPSSCGEDPSSGKQGASSSSLNDCSSVAAIRARVSQSAMQQQSFSSAQRSFLRSTPSPPDP